MSIGIWQIVLILAIVLIIFGAGKLPRVMGDVAKGVKNFKAGMKEGQTPETTTTTTQAPAEPKVIDQQATAPAPAPAPAPAETSASAAKKTDEAANG